MDAIVVSFCACGINADQFRDRVRGQNGQGRQEKGGGAEKEFC